MGRRGGIIDEICEGESLMARGVATSQSTRNKVKNARFVTPVTVTGQLRYGTTDKEIAPAAPVPVAAVATEFSLPAASKLNTCRSGLPPLQITSRYFPVESRDIEMGVVPVVNGELESAVKAPLVASV